MKSSSCISVVFPNMCPGPHCALAVESEILVSDWLREVACLVRCKTDLVHSLARSVSGIL